MEKQQKCISCHKKIVNIRGSVKFKCPNCEDYEIIRCEHCRKVAAKFQCPKCEFEGPN